ADKIVGGHPALLNKSTNMCFYCGQIKIEDDGQDLGGVTIGNQSSTNNGPSTAGFGQGPACEKPLEKPSMLDDFIKGISKLGDVPAAMKKAASELPGALEKAANDLPRGL
ncbi:PAAR-like protein, partial [Brevibacillus formosus]|uniref:PAAR-like protein n=1 Tax=Brevibacillus formosus TaxID=54913 RepID=UPI003F19CEFE